MGGRRVRIVVRGVVQGVGFRYRTQEQGTALGLTGFVRNTNDGAVEVEAEGREVAVDELINWLKTGPRHAAVESVEIVELTPSGIERTFEIVR